MNKQDIVKLLLLIKAEYPREHAGTNEATTKAQIELWHTMLNEFETKNVFIAFQKHIASEEGKYKPSIHHLLKNLNSLTNGEAKTSGEAWEDVLSAIRRYGIYEQSSAISCFDDLTRKTVNSIGFREICLSENIETLRAQFRNFYELNAKKQRDFNNMPEYLQRIQLTANKRIGMQSIKEMIDNKKMEG